jgi:hypothetical protein
MIFRIDPTTAFDVYMVSLRMDNSSPLWYRNYQKRGRPVNNSITNAPPALLWHSDINKASFWVNKSVAKRIVKRLYKESPYYTNKNIKICRFSAIYQDEE